MDTQTLLRLVEILVVGVVGLLTKVVLGMQTAQKDIVKTQYVINYTLANHFQEDLKVQREISAGMAAQNELLRGVQQGIEAVREEIERK